MDCKKTNGFSESVGSVTVLSKPCRKVPRAIRGKFTFGEIFCYNIIVSEIQASKIAAVGSRRSFKAVGSGRDRLHIFAYVQLVS